MPVQKRKKNLYITCEARSLKNTKNCLWKRYAVQQSHSDHLLAYTQARNALRTLTHNLCNQFERQIANNILSQGFLELCKEQNENTSSD